MRLPLFRIRTMMVVVAAIATAIGCAREVIRLSRLSWSYRGRADTCAYLERSMQRDIQDIDTGRLAPREDFSQAEIDDMAKLFRKRIPYFRAMSRKYDYAARHPWLPVAPDAPKPE